MLGELHHLDEQALERATGEVMLRVQGTAPRYRLVGDEMFVRATVTASLPADNPVFAGQRRQAWVQPVVPAR